MESYSTIASERKYHNVDGQYQLPNDSPEHQRLDAQSQSLVALMHSQPFHATFSAPPKKIIDVGCGTGAMTSILASLYPSAQVIGVDLSAVPTSSHSRPGNLEFVQGDIRELMRTGGDDRFRPGTCDYVFERLLMLGVVDWPAHLEAVSRLLKPGGWLEVQEADMRMRTPDDESVSQKWWHTSLLKEDTKAHGLDPEVGSKLRGYLVSVGLENVQEQVFPFPAVSRKDRPELDGLGDNIFLLFSVLQSKVSALRRSEEELKKMEEDMKGMFKQEGVADNHFNFHAVVGQKA